MTELLPIPIDAGPGGRWLAAGLDAAAKAALILLGVGLLAMALRRSSAAARHLAWCLGLAGALALLPMSLVLPRWGMPVLPEPAPAPAPVASLAPVPVSVPLDGRAIGPATPSAMIDPLPTPPGPGRPAGPGRASTRSGWAAWIVAGWASVAVIVLAPLAIAAIRTRQLARRCERIEGGPWAEAAAEVADRLGIARRVVLLRGQPGAMPMTWGLLRPIVLVPGGSDDWPAERRRVVLTHELAHVRRRDCLTQAIGRLACAAYWFNPLAWLAAGRLRVERERACDDLVLRAGERPSAYAGHLLTIARTHQAPSDTAAAAVARPGRRSSKVACGRSWTRRGAGGGRPGGCRPRGSWRCSASRRRWRPCDWRGGSGPTWWSPGR